MSSAFEDIPQRIFLDSSTLQYLQSHGGYIYEEEPLASSDRIHRDPLGVQKLDALRLIMKVAQRAPFEFALSEQSFREVEKKGDRRYLSWAYDVLDHWLVCLAESGRELPLPGAGLELDGPSYGYLGKGDRALLKDAIALGCDAFLTMENKLPKNADHIQRMLNIRVLSPIDMWECVRPWARLFY